MISGPFRLSIGEYPKEWGGNLCIDMLKLTEKCTYVLDVQMSLDQL